MVRGIENFKEWFRGYEDQYVIIGGLEELLRCLLLIPTLDPNKLLDALKKELKFHWKFSLQRQ